MLQMWHRRFPNDHDQLHTNDVKYTEKLNNGNLKNAQYLSLILTQKIAILIIIIVITTVIITKWMLP